MKLRFISNSSISKVRKATLHGRAYLVAPVNALVEGVLEGSQGALFYPAEEILKDPDSWNGVPAVLGHPYDEDGNEVSARSPSVANSQEVGRIFNTEVIENKDRTTLRPEVWLDVAACNRSKDGQRLLAKLQAGKPVEVSTGLFTENYAAEAGATFNGKPYDYIARNYKPDHLAILLNDVGACSIKDGCGLLVNRRNQSCQCGGKCSCKGTTTMTPKRRTFLVKWLATNCACYRGASKALAKLPAPKLISLGKIHGAPKPTANAEGEDGDTKLKEMLAWVLKGPTGIKARVASAIESIFSAEAAEEETEAEEMVEETAANEDVVEEEEEAVNMETEEEEEVANEDGEEPEEEVTNEAEEEEVANEAEEEEPVAMKRGKGKAATKNKATKNKATKQPAKQKPLSTNAWIANAPKPVQELIRNALEIEKSEKIAVITRLVSNVKDKAKKKALAVNLAVKPLSELKSMLDLIPGKQSSAPRFDFSGQAIGEAVFATNASDGVDDPIPETRIDWSKNGKQ